MLPQAHCAICARSASIASSNWHPILEVDQGRRRYCDHWHIQTTFLSSRPLGSSARSPTSSPPPLCADRLAISFCSTTGFLSFSFRGLLRAPPARPRYTSGAFHRCLPACVRLILLVSPFSAPHSAIHNSPYLGAAPINLKPCASRASSPSSLSHRPYAVLHLHADSTTMADRAPGLDPPKTGGGCFNCGSQDHFAYACPEPVRKEPQ